MKVWMYLRLVIGLLFRKRLHFILLTTIHRFKIDFSVFCSICLKSGNMKPLVAKWPCCFKDIFISLSIYIYASYRWPPAPRIIHFICCSLDLKSIVFADGLLCFISAILSFADEYEGPVWVRRYLFIETTPCSWTNHSRPSWEDEQR